MRIDKYKYCLALSFLLSACSDEELSQIDEHQVVTITSEIKAFEGESETRVNYAGNDFNNGDLMRLKIVCPFSSDTEHGETTYGNSSDAFFLFKRNGSAWSRVLRGDGFDITGSYSASDSPDITSSSYYQAQQTPYVYTAITWTEEKLFISNGNLYDQYANVFHADQSKLENYLASDLLWAQAYAQTGTWTIHLGFVHKMACLDITVNGVSANAIVTVENMPDIDQGEVVVGDYYARHSKINSGYGYREKATCKFDNHGKVIGVAEVNDTLKHAVVHPFGGMTDIGGFSGYQGSQVPNNATYTAYKNATGQYRLIVPPCTISEKVEIWVRDGAQRFSVVLNEKENDVLKPVKFEEGKLYPVVLLK